MQNIEYNEQKDSLFYIDKQKDGLTLKRLVTKEDEKSSVFEECQSADFSGHAGRESDNTRQEGQAACMLGEKIARR